VACVLISSGVVRADLSASDAYTGAAVALRQAALVHAFQLQGKYHFDRVLRPDLADQSASSVTTSVTPLPFPGDLDTTAASGTPTATFHIGDGSVLDGGSVTSWPSGRYTESIQSWIGLGGAVTGNVSEVPLPASALLAMLGLGIVGVGRAHFARRG